MVFYKHKKAPLKTVFVLSGAFKRNRKFVNTRGLFLIPKRFQLLLTRSDYFLLHIGGGLVIAIKSHSETAQSAANNHGAQ